MKKRKVISLHKHNQPWSQREERLLEKLYLSTQAIDLAIKLGRTEVAVRSRARQLGIKKNPEKSASSRRIWSEKELKKLKKLWKQGYSRGEIAKMMVRTFASIKAKLKSQFKENALQKKYWPTKPWSKRETNYLIKNYPKMSMPQLRIALGRSKGSIRGKAERLNLMEEGFEVWSNEEIKTLRRLWQEGYSCPQIAEKIGRTCSSIQNRIHLQKQIFGLKNRNKIHPWTKKDTDYLVRHYKNKTIRELSEILGRRTDSIKYKAQWLNLTDKAVGRWSTREINMLKKYYTKWPNSKFVEKLGRTPGAIKTKAISLVLKKLNR